MKTNGYSFNRIAVGNFRRLRRVEVELRPLTVLIGANGSGKTSFLDVWRMMAAAGTGRLGDFLSSQGGLAEIITRETPTNAKLIHGHPVLAGLSFIANQAVRVELAMTVPGYESLQYSLDLEPWGNGYQIAQESLTQPKQAKGIFKHIECIGSSIRYFDYSVKKLIKPIKPTWQYNHNETALSQVPKMFKEPELFLSQMTSSTYYGPLNVAPQAPVRLPQQMSPAELPGRDGEDLISCLFSLRETDRDRFEMVEDTLRAAFPDFERLDFPPVAAGMLAMTWKDQNFKKPMYMSQLSEGTLRYLWLTTLLSSTALPAITLIDEPEVSLHPELLMLLAEQLRAASSRTQLIVATHSDRLIRFLKPKEVLVCDTENGETRMQWADQMDIEHWLKDYSLDEIWGMGKLGGRA